MKIKWILISLLFFSCATYAAKSGTAIQVTGTDAFCQGYTASTTGGVTTLDCVPVGGGGPGAPTGCGATINLTTSVTLPSSGGTVVLNATCATPSSGIIYTWFRDGVLGVANVSNWSDTLPANTGTSTVVHTYQVRACVSTSCVIVPTTALQANVAGSTGGAWAGTCPGFTNTIVGTYNWAAPARLFTGPMLSTDVWVIQFTTGSVSTTSSLPRATAAEWTSPPSSRTAVLSATPCDFGPQPTPGATSVGNSVNLVFALGTGTGFGFYPVLALNTRYFVNIKNTPGATCTTSCDMFSDLVKAGGL